MPNYLDLRCSGNLPETSFNFTIRTGLPQAATAHRAVVLPDLWGGCMLEKTAF